LSTILLAVDSLNPQGVRPSPEPITPSPEPSPTVDANTTGPHPSLTVGVRFPLLCPSLPPALIYSLTHSFRPSLSYSLID